MSEVILTYSYIPSGEYYGRPAYQVDASVTDIIGTTVCTVSTTDGTIVSGVTFRGVRYSATVDTSDVAGPYVDVAWTATDASGTILDTENSRSLLIPPNYEICIEFTSDVVSVSGVTYIDADEEFCYATTFDPFYVPIDYFREQTFGAFESASDLTVAKIIHKASLDADSETFCDIDSTDSRYPYLSYARQLYAIQKPLSDYIRYVVTTEGSVSKKLADLEIALQRGSGMGLRILMTELFKELRDIRKVLNSCGSISMGASAKPAVGRIADLYDRSVFGRFFEVDMGQGLIAYLVPPSRNHLFTDPYSTYWLK